MVRITLYTSALFGVLVGVCALAQSPRDKPGDRSAPELPRPFATPSVVKHPKVVGWSKGRTPTAAAGFQVTAYARDLDSPRWLHVLPNGDVLVAQSRTLPKPKKETEDAEEKKKDEEKEKGQKEARTVTGTSPNRITLLRGVDADGAAEVRAIFLEGLTQPFGMALVDDSLFVGNTDAVVVFPYQPGQKRIESKGTKVLDLPAGGYNNHWTRNVLAGRDGKKLYVSVGSASDHAEHGTAEELLRANILEVNRDGTALRVFASGLRNPVGMDWEPVTGKLWTAVNERDGLGDDLVPDYLTSVKDGGFYGWPYSYFGGHEDPRRKGERPDLVKKALVPDFALGSHTASLGLAFYRGTAFPERYHGGAFVGQRGSWNRSKLVGYRVAFVPFKEGKPAGQAEDFLTGFLASDTEAYGRPIGVAVAADGALLVADEPGNVVWRVSVDRKRR